MVSMIHNQVRVSRTPNPNAMKFTLEGPVVPGDSSRSIASAEAAKGDPVAELLFAIPGVSGLFMVADFVTVMKEPSASWDDLTPPIVAALTDAFA